MSDIVKKEETGEQRPSSPPTTNFQITEAVTDSKPRAAEEEAPKKSLRKKLNPNVVQYNPNAGKPAETKPMVSESAPFVPLQMPQVPQPIPQVVPQITPQVIPQIIPQGIPQLMSFAPRVPGYVPGRFGPQGQPEQMFQPGIYPAYPPYATYGYQPGFPYQAYVGPNTNSYIQAAGAAPYNPRFQQTFVPPPVVPEAPPRFHQDERHHFHRKQNFQNKDNNYKHKDTHQEHGHNNAHNHPHNNPHNHAHNHAEFPSLVKEAGAKDAREKETEWEKSVTYEKKLPKPEPKVEAKPELKVEPKPAAKADEKVVFDPNAKESKIGDDLKKRWMMKMNKSEAYHPDQKTEKKPETETKAPEPEAKAPEPEKKEEKKVEEKVEVKPEVKVEAKVEVKAEAKAPAPTPAPTPAPAPAPAPTPAPAPAQEAPKKEEPKPAEPVAENRSKFYISPEEIATFLANYTLPTPLPKNIKDLDREFIAVNAAPKGRNTGKDNMRGRQNNRDSRVSFEQPQKVKTDGPTIEIARPKVNEADLKIIKEIKQKASDWLVSKKDDTPEVKLVRSILAELNKLSLDNFEVVSNEIISKCTEEWIADKIIENIVSKAWKEPVFTQVYAQLVNKMIKHHFTWEVADKKTAIKKKLLVPVEKEFNDGFQRYYDYCVEVSTRTDLHEEEKFEMLSKRKKILLGNITFICELYNLKILNFSVMKWAIVLGITNFLKEYVADIKKKDQYSIKEDYIEALICLFENSGETLEKKEKTHKQKEPPTDHNFYSRFLQIFDDEVNKTEELIDYADHNHKFIESPTTLFFNFLDHIKDKLSVRIGSLIDNLIELRNNKWVAKIKRIEAAKSLAAGKKAAEMEQIVEKEDRKGGRKPQTSAPQGKKDKNGGEYVKKESATERPFEELREKAAKFAENNANETSKPDFEKMILGSGLSPQTAFRLFFETFGLGVKNLKTLDPRIEVGERFLAEKMISVAQFSQICYDAYKVSQLDHCDHPKILDAYAEFFYRLRSNDLIKLEDIKLTPVRPEITDADELDDMKFFIKDTFAKIQSVFEKESGDKYKAELDALDKVINN